MMKIVIGSVGVGIIFGYFLMSPEYFAMSETLLTIGLCILLFFVGMDIGIEGNAINNIKNAGLKILAFPMMVILGTYTGAILASLFLPITILESLMIGSGFGWYSLAPIMIAEKSVELSAISFLHNVFRELLAFIFIPFVAQHIGYLETISLPGAASMDVCLPLVERSTNGTIAIYSFVMGLFLSATVPVMVGIFLQLL